MGTDRVTIDLPSYLSIDTDDGLKIEIDTDKYVIDYYEEFILPYTKRQILKDFDIELKDNTHIKCILRLNK